MSKSPTILLDYVYDDVRIVIYVESDSIFNEVLMVKKVELIKGGKDASSN